MARIVDYCVVHDENVSTAMNEIRAMIREGWQPFGSLAVCAFDDSVWKYQPMVRYEEPAPTPKPALPPGITLVESSLPGTTK